MKRKEFRPETDPSVVVLLIIGIFFFFWLFRKKENGNAREKERVIQILEKPFGLGLVWCGVER